MPHSPKSVLDRTRPPGDSCPACAEATQKVTVTYGTRAAYATPAIICRQRIETMAADCTIPGGKNDATCILGFS
ncbi:MAG: hypothetical protein AAGM22_05170 [Acidobacteriota bacterium]